MTCMSCGCSSLPCGCCEGITQVTPASVQNRAGLDTLSYRVGTHGQFLESMLSRLSCLPGLTTRDPSDPAIALLDCWAVIGDVLSFYQERIANEGYLRTCSERQSVVELAGLIGYVPRPGVSASVYLAYTIDAAHTDPTVIPAGARSQTIPGPGETPQSFETSEDLEARAEWNVLQPRLTRPQTFFLNGGDITADGSTPASSMYIAGTDAGLRAGDRLLFLFSTTDLKKSVVRAVAGTEVNYKEKRTLVSLQPLSPPDTAVARSKNEGFGFVKSLLVPPIAQVANSLQLRRTLDEGFLVPRANELRAVASQGGGADGSSQLLVDFAPRLKSTYYRAWSSAAWNPAQPRLAAVYVMRASVAPFGSTAGPRLTPAGTIDRERDWDLDPDTESKVGLWLDQADDAIAPGSYVAILKDNKGPEVLQVKSAQTRPRTAYGLSFKSTQLTLGDAWWDPSERDGFDVLRNTQVYARSEPLQLTDAPINDDLEGQSIELNGLYRELQPGRWVILSGERTDITGVTGVIGTELLMIAAVNHGFDANLPGDQTHTTLSLATSTAYRYKRDTASVSGNVVKATHGETRTEVLGSANGTELQAFTLRQRPVTYVSAPTAAGAKTSLHVFVNGVEWHETDALAGLSPTDRKFVTQVNDSGVRSVLFGDGRQGARPPTGQENVAAVYRTGIGIPGNVRAAQVKLLQTRPLGVKEVVNPLAAAGGADRETLDQARQNAPLAVMALDRLVAVQDYADFARTFAGIAKATAQRTTDGLSEVICLTIAGADDAEIDTNSDLYRNLLGAFVALADADLPVNLVGRERIALLLSAGVRILPDYPWERVVAAVRAALLDRFGFERRLLGQAVALSEVIAVMNAVPGVDYVDVDVFTGIPDHINAADGSRVLITPDAIALRVADALSVTKPRLTRLQSGAYCASVPTFPGGFDKGLLRPAQLAIFTPTVPHTLVLNQIK